MPRTFADIDMDTFKEKVDAAIDWEEGAYQLRDKFPGDLKVDFDFENFETGSGGPGPTELMGYQTLSNGMIYLGMCAGGDWEFPVFFIMYWDGRKIRIYVPTDGNPWNTDTKKAYGNGSIDEDGSDLKNAKKRWPDIYKEADSAEADDFEFDSEAITADIMNRIVKRK